MQTVSNQRTRILDATLALMASEGTSGTSMRAVAAASGLNVATLYHYFPSKRDLCQAAIAYRLSDNALGFPFPEGLPGRVEDRLGALLDHFFVSMSDEADLWRALMAEAIHGDDDVLQPLLDVSRVVRSRARDVDPHVAPRRARAARPGSRARAAQRRDRRDGGAPAPTRGATRGARRARQGARFRVRSIGDEMTAPAPDFELDALDPTLFVRGVAHDVFDYLRNNDPVHWDERNNLWVISKYEDVSYVERQPELFCSGQGIRPKGGGAGNLSIVSLDDPEHARQRRLVSRGFTPSRINQMFDHVRELARGLVDSVAARGECDFVEDIAKPLPLIVIAELLGLPVEDRLQLGEWSDTMMSAEGAEDDTDPRLQRAGDGMGRLRHLPRRAARGPARPSEGRPDLDPLCSRPTPARSSSTRTSCSRSSPRAASR